MSEVEVSERKESALADLARELLEDEETAYEYLKEGWIASAVASLREARREAGLSQEEVANVMGTKQPAIARLEKDHEGSFSLRRFAEYALACDVLPLDILLKPAEILREHALNDPEAPKTELAYEHSQNIVNHTSFARYPHEPDFSQSWRWAEEAFTCGHLLSKSRAFSAEPSRHYVEEESSQDRKGYGVRCRKTRLGTRSGIPSSQSRGVVLDEVAKGTGKSSRLGYQVAS